MNVRESSLNSERILFAEGQGRGYDAAVTPRRHSRYRHRAPVEERLARN